MLQRHLTLLFFLIAAFPEIAFSQSKAIDSFRSISKYEKRWVIFHPFVARKASKITEFARAQAENIRQDSILDNNATGGQLDAFRHGIWMATLSKNIGGRKSRKLGIAHEKGNLNDGSGSVGHDSLHCRMDILNNEIGIEIGLKNKKLSDSELVPIIKHEVISGFFLIVDYKCYDWKNYIAKPDGSSCLVPSDNKNLLNP